MAKAKAGAAKTPTKKAAKRGKKIQVNRVRAVVVPKKETLGKDGPIHMEVFFNDKHFEGNTDDIGAALLSIAPDKLNTKTILKFSLAGVKNGKVVERVLMIPMARRLFNNDVQGQLITKSIKMALGYNGETAN